MQIKTLAEIIAENTKEEKLAKPSSKRSKKNRQYTLCHNQQPNPTHRKQHSQQRGPQNSKSRVKKLFARDFSASESNANQADYANGANVSDDYASDAYALNTEQPNPSDRNLLSANEPVTKPRNKKRNKKKTFHPASPYQPKIEVSEPVEEVNPNNIKNLLAQVKSQTNNEQPSNLKSSLIKDSLIKDSSFEQSSKDNVGPSVPLDNLPTALKAYLKTAEQRQAEKEEIKANSRLRWLAFYYLSRREHSAGELRQKLIDKEQDPQKVDELLLEFAEKGYQSDYRTALMLIREGIRKGRGRLRIKNDFYKRKVEVPSNIDELIDMATEDNQEFVDVLSDNDMVEGVDWLRLAVEARVKKYGDEIPKDPKIKARQLRFLQYRGFQPDICFQAITYNLQTLDERF